MASASRITWQVRAAISSTAWVGAPGNSVRIFPVRTDARARALLHCRGRARRVTARPTCSKRGAASERRAACVAGAVMARGVPRGQARRSSARSGASCGSRGALLSSRYVGGLRSLSALLHGAGGPGLNHRPGGPPDHADLHARVDPEAQGHPRRHPPGREAQARRPIVRRARDGCRARRAALRFGC